MNFLRITHIFFLTSLLSIATKTAAQIHIGARSGLNLAKVIIKEDDISTHLGAKPGVNFAFLLNKTISPLLSLQIEPGFSQLGAKYKETWSDTWNNEETTYVDETKVFFNYLELPVLLQLKPKLGNLELVLSAGPQLRYLVGKAKSEYTSKTYVDGVLEDTEIENETLNGEDAIKNFDYGISAGIGVSVPIGNLKVFGEGRYNWGFSNITKEYEDEKGFNRVLAINLGVLIPLKK